MSLTRCHKQTTRTGITLYIKNYYKKQALHNDVGNLNDVIKMMMKKMQLNNMQFYTDFAWYDADSCC